MMPESVKAEARKAGVSIYECVNLDEVVAKSVSTFSRKDMIIVTRRSCICSILSHRMSFT